MAAPEEASPSVQTRTLGERIVTRLRDRIAERLPTRGEDAGQAMIIVLFLILVLSTIAPLVAVQVDGEVPTLIRAANERAAVAALSAGVQFYRNHLDTDPNYATQTGCTTPTNEGLGTCSSGAVVPTFCTGLAPGSSVPSSTVVGVIPDNGSCDPALQFTNPPEAFVYVPNQSFLYNQSGGSAGNLLLTVYGRGGTPNDYQYATELVSFQEESIFSYAYVSEYEVLDPNTPQISDTDGPSPQDIGVEWSDVNPSGQTVSPEPYTAGYDTPLSIFGNESAWQALCQYKTWQPNTFVDANFEPGGSPVYGVSVPQYYGPWYGSSTYNLTSTKFSFTVSLSNPLPDGGTSEVVTVNPGAGNGSIGVPPCGLPYDFTSSDNVTGPVATGDQIRICGAPTFSGGSLGIPSVSSGAPAANIYYVDQNHNPYHYPGSVKVVAAGHGFAGNETPNGPYPDTATGQYAPSGFWYDEYTCGIPVPPGASGQTGNGFVGSSGTSGSLRAKNVLYAPNAVHGVELNASVTLPNPSQLASFGELQTGSNSYGCTFTGPTMIELYWDPGKQIEAMDVWSPLSGRDGPDANLATGNPTSPQCSEPAGTNGNTDDFSLTNPLVTDIPVPTKQYIAPGGGLSGDGVIYVRSPTNLSWSSDGCSNVGVPTCPYNYLSPPASSLPAPPANEPDYYFCPFEAESFVGLSAAQCMQGDAYIEGQLTGQLTVATQGNIIVTRDTTVNCADTPSYSANPQNPSTEYLSGPNAKNPSTITNCAIETYPDVLGLVANVDVDLAYDPEGAGSLAGTPPGAPGIGLAGICPNELLNSADLSPNNGPNAMVPADIWPSCLVKNPIIDAAVVAAHGSFGVQESSNCPLLSGAQAAVCQQTNGNALTLNGSDIGFYRGPFGLHSGTQAISGYNKVLSWDTRLQTAPPPAIVPQSSESWVVSSVTGCNAINPAIDTAGICSPFGSPFGVTSSYGGTTVPPTSSPGTIITLPTTTTSSTTTMPSTTTTTKPTTTTSSSTTTTTKPTTTTSSSTTTTTKPTTTSSSSSTTTTTGGSGNSTTTVTTTTTPTTSSSSSTSTTHPSTTMPTASTVTSVTTTSLATTTSSTSSTTTTLPASTTTTLATTTTTPTTTTSSTTTTLPASTTTTLAPTTSSSSTTSSTTSSTSSTTTSTTTTTLPYDTGD